MTSRNVADAVAIHILPVKNNFQVKYDLHRTISEKEFIEKKCIKQHFYGVYGFILGFRF